MAKRKETFKSLQRKLERVKKARARDIERSRNQRKKLKERAKKLRHALNQTRMKVKELRDTFKKARKVTLQEVKDSLRVAWEDGYLHDMVDNWADVFEVDESEIYDLYEEDAA